MDKPGIEIIEPPAPVEIKTPTVDEAVDMGLTSAEIDSAKAHGLVEEPKKEDPKPDPEPKPDPDPKPDLKEGDDDGKKEEGQKERQLLDQDLDPEKEHAALEKFNQNERALYWRFKKEKTKRQNLESDRDQALIKLKAQEKSNLELQERLKKLEDKLAKPAPDPDPLDEGKDPEIKDPAEKPLTVKDLEEREKQKQEQAEAERAKRQERAEKLSGIHKELEIDAKSRYTDFDKTSELASEIVKAAHEGHLDQIFPDPRVRSRVQQKVFQLLSGLAQADQFRDGDYNPADMAYELGQSHPKYGKPSPTDNGKSGKDQGLSPEEIEKIAKRRQSSASLTGGGSRRVISYDEITLEQASRLSDDQFRKLPREVRNRLLGAP